MKGRLRSSWIPKKHSDAPALKIRRARTADAARLAGLSGQLGYPATKKDILQRMKRIKPSSSNAIFVAEISAETEMKFAAQSATRKHRVVSGWLHVSVTPLLEAPLRAEVNGLVVDENQRSVGAGAKLLAAAEKWAAAKGCKSMSVRSNVIRERAHGFYERNGYEHYKTQKAFRKPL